MKIENSRVSVKGESWRLLFNTKVLAHKANNLKYGESRNTDARGDVYFVGQTMKESKGSANPQVVNKLLKERLS